MSEEEKKAVEDLKNILKYWQTIVDIEDDIEREIEMNCYSEEMPFKQLKIALNLIEKLQKEIEELRKLAEFQKGYRKKLEQDLFENCSNFVVSKDKIREKIEELKKAGTTETRNNKNEVIEKHYFLQDEIDVLKELLEEK